VYEVLVEGLQIYAYHGVPDAEREIGHRYLIDLKLEVDGKADQTDDVAETVDYGIAGQIAEETAVKSQFRTVERLARVIADGLLEAFALLQSVEVTVRKPLPPAPILAEAAGVRIRVSR